jgi:hypothetical protein
MTRFEIISFEFLNARLPGSVLVMNQILKSEPYGLVKALRLFTNSYNRNDARCASRTFNTRINDTGIVLIVARAIIDPTWFGHRLRRGEAPRDFELRTAE